jgi:hypothetical protein
MKKFARFVFLAAFSSFALCGTRRAQEAAPPNLTIDWSKTVITSMTTPSLQVVVNPQLLRGAKLHDGSFAALKMLGAD